MNEKMKIGFIAEAYPPISGGVATSTQRIARELVKLNCDVVILTFDNTTPITSEDICFEEIENDIKIYRIGPFFLKNPPISTTFKILDEKYKAILRRRAYNQMLNVLKNEKVDILLSFYVINSGYLAQMLANELHLKHVVGIRGNDIGCNIFNINQFAVTKWVLDECDAIVSVNNHLMNRTLTAFKELKNKICCIKNGFQCQDIKHNIELKNTIIEKNTWNKTDTIITFIGSLREKKGTVILAKAIKQLVDKDFHVRLMVIGPDISGAEKIIIGNLWEELKENHIIYVTGQIPRIQVLDYASIADVVCMPSLDDGMANGLLEGMSVGLCPVTTTIMNDVITDKENGRIVKPGDVLELTQALIDVITDKDLLISYGKLARETIIKKHNPKLEAENYIKLFENILDKK